MVETNCKGTRISRRGIEHTDCFYCTQRTNETHNLPLQFQKVAIFNITTFSLHLWTSVDADFCISLANVTSGVKSDIFKQVCNYFQ